MTDFSSTLSPLSDLEKMQLIVQAAAQLESSLYGQTIVESVNADGSENRSRIAQSGATYVASSTTSGKSLWIVRVTTELPAGWQATGNPVWDLATLPT